MARILITSAIPYINGIKHLGNLVGSQLPADLFARFNRAIGNEVMFICATDEHGTPAELAAAKAGKPVATAPCADPGKFVYTPAPVIATTAAASVPAATAPAAPAAPTAAAPATPAAPTANPPAKK